MKPHQSIDVQNTMRQSISTSSTTEGKQPKTFPTKPPRTATIREKKEQNQQSPGSTSKKQGKHSKTDLGKNKKTES